MRRDPIVSVWCWYRVGSRDERPGITGISHWVEHMNFKGTRTIPKDQVVRRVELAGGIWNGYTWLDVTTYFETVEAAALEEMIRLEASRMSGCVYDEEEVGRERNVVISELQGGENDPRTYLDREVTGTALQAHPYRWPTIGYLSDSRHARRPYRHYRAHYSPATPSSWLRVTVSGRPRLVRRHFSRIPGNRRVRTVEPEQSGERRVTVRGPQGRPASTSPGRRRPPPTASSPPCS
jgi:zinc protease